jgi:hypothetical protein
MNRLVKIDFPPAVPYQDDTREDAYMVPGYYYFNN